MKNQNTEASRRASGNLRAPRQRSRAALLGALMLAISGTAVFGGQGAVQVAQVVNGTAQFRQNGLNTIITASNRSIINYYQFNVATGAAVQFVQPSAASWVLNRVITAAPSQINGNISANGTVYLVNPAGVIFGPGSVVNAGQFFAAAAHLSDQDALQGILHFTGAQGAVSNHGTITANTVGLVGLNVANTGSIVAAPGTVVLAAGQDVLLGDRNGGLLVKIAAPASPAMAPAAGTGVDNSGRIQASSVSMAAGDIYSLSIRDTGQTQAGSITLQGGQQGAVQVSGVLDASHPGGAGGTVQVTGAQVNLTGATVNAGGTSGGMVEIGGGLHGGGGLPTAAVTTVDAATTLSTGAGGTVVVWSEQFTGFHGTANAPAGLVETSSHGRLDVTGAVINAPGGTWLLDPADMEITANNSSLTTNSGGNPDQFSSTATLNTQASQVSAADISNRLNAGTSVTITTSSALTQSGTITLDAGADILKTAGGDATLRLFAAGGVALDGAIRSTTGKLNVTIAAEDGVSATGAAYLNNAISTNGGNLTVGASAISLGTAAPITINTGAGAQNYNGPVGLLADSTLLSTDTVTGIQFASTVDGSHALVLSTPRLSSGDVIGGVVPLNSLGVASDAWTLPTATQVTGSVAISNYTAGNTLGVKDAATALNITAAQLATISAPSLTLGRVLNTDASILTTNTGGLNVATDAAVNENRTLSFVTAGTLNVNGNVISTGSQSFSGNQINLNATLDNSTNPGVALTMQARGSVVFTSGAGITTANGDVSITGNSAAAPGGTPVAPALTMDQTNTISTGSGNITLALDTLVAVAGNLTAGNLTTTGNIVLGNPGGNVVILGTLNGGALTSTGVGFDNSSANAGASISGVININHTGVVRIGTPLAANQVAITGSQIDLSVAAGTATAVATSGFQTYNSPVQLKADTQLTTTNGGTVSFNSTVDSDTLGPWALSITTSNAGGPAGNIEFGNGTAAAYVGSSHPLASLTTTAASTAAPGQTVFNMADTTRASATTTGAQTYNNPVVLAGAAVLQSNGSAATGTITFGSTVDGSVAGSQALTINTAGSIIFQDLVGSLIPLQSLVTDDPGVIVTGGPLLLEATGTPGAPSVTTAGNQTYNNPLVLKAHTQLTANGGGSISFNSTVDGDGNSDAAGVLWTLGIDTSFTTTSSSQPGDVQFGNGTSTALVGAGNPLGSLRVTAAGQPGSGLSGTTKFTIPGSSASVPAVTTTGEQIYNSPVVLLQDTNLTATQNISPTSGQGTAVTFDSTVDSGATARRLWVNTSYQGAGPNGSAGNINFGQNGQNYVGGTAPLESLHTTAAALGAGTPGVTAFYMSDTAKPTVTTTGAQQYDNPVYLDTNSIFKATGNATGPGSVTFNATVDGSAVTMAVDASYSYSGPGALANANGGTIQFGSGGPDYVGSNSALLSLTTTAAGVGSGGLGTTTFTMGDTAKPSVTTTGGQTYNDAVVLGASAVLYDSGGTNITFASTINGGFALTVNTDGSQVFNGLIGNTTPLASLTTNDPANATAPLLGTTNPVQFNAAGTAGAPSVTTTGNQDYFNPVALYAGSVALNSTAGGTITFHATVDGTSSGGQALSVNTTGSEIFQAAVGATAPLASLTTDDPAAGLVGTLGPVLFQHEITPPLTAAPASVTTTGNQTYGNPVQLQADTQLTTTAGGNVWFKSTVDSDATVGGWALGVDTSLVGGVAGNIQFGSGGANYVGAVHPLASLTVTAVGSTPGATKFDIVGTSSPSLSTMGVQAYHTPVTLLADTVLLSQGTGVSGAITFDSTIQGRFALGTASAGTVAFNGVIGGNSAPLTSLTTNDPIWGISGGNVHLNAGMPGGQATVTTTSKQEYHNAVVLQANTQLTTTTGGSVTLDSTVDGDGNGPWSLAITTSYAAGANGSAGNIQFGSGGANYVGGVHPLLTLTTTAAGAGSGAVGNTIFDITTTAGVSATTTGLQTFNNPVSLAQNTVLTSSGGSNLTFQSTVDGAMTLALNTAGVTVFNGAVGHTTPLVSLVTDAGGATQFNMTAPGGSNPAGVNVSGNLTIGDAMVVNVAGSTPAAPSVQTGGGQLYSSTITLQQAAVLRDTGTAQIKVLGKIDGAFTLTVNTGGLTEFDAAIGQSTPLASLTTDASGTTTLKGGSVVTTGSQNYGDPVTLAVGTTTLTSTGQGDIVFGQTLRGTSATTINTAGAVRFNGLVGGNNQPLASLTVNDPSSGISGGQVYLSASGSAANPSILTTGAQTFNSAVLLAAATQLTTTAGGSVTFTSTIDSAPGQTVGLAIDTSYVATAQGNGGSIYFGNGTANSVGGNNPLLSLTTTANGAGTGVAGTTVIQIGDPVISTTTAQVYNNPVLLAADVQLLAGAGVSFNSTVDGTYALSIGTGGNVIFLQLAGAQAALKSLTIAPTYTTVPAGAGPADSPVIFYAAGTTAAPTVLTTGSQTYSIPVHLAADVQLTSTTGNITFSSAIDSHNDGGGNRSLGVTAASGTISLGNSLPGGMALGAVGSVLPLNQLTLTSPSIALASNVTTTGDQLYAGPVTVTGTPLTLAASGTGNITLASTLTGAQTALTIQASQGSVTIGGVATLYSLNVAAGNNVTVGMTDTTGAIVLQPGTGLSQGPNGTTDLRPDSILTLNGNLTATSGGIVLAGTGLADVPSVATIVGSAAAGNIMIAAPSFTMGRNEKFTVFGNLTINTPGTATIGDINTGGDLSITAGNITILLRTGGPVVGTDGTLLPVYVPPASVDIVSLGSLYLNMQPTLSWSGTVIPPGPLFAWGYGTAAVPGYVEHLLPSRSLRQLSGPGGTVLDLEAQGPVPVDLALLLPRNGFNGQRISAGLPWTPGSGTAYPPASAQGSGMGNLQPVFDVLTVGAMGSGTAFPDGSGSSTPADAMATIGQAQALFCIQTGVDATGAATYSSALDGQKVADLRTAIGAAVSAYLTSSHGAAFAAAGFETFLDEWTDVRAPKARAALTTIRKLLRMIDAAPGSRAHKEQLRHVLVALVAPGNLTARQWAQVVAPGEPAANRSK